MLAETVGHFLQGKTDVFQADFFADQIERHVRKTVVHGPHHARQHGAVADAGVEYAHGRGTRMDIGELERDAARDHPFFAAGVDEQEILLPVIEEAEIALRIARRYHSGSWVRRGWRHWGSRLARGFDDGGTSARNRFVMVGNECADAVDGSGRDAPAVT